MRLRQVKGSMTEKYLEFRKFKLREIAVQQIREIFQFLKLLQLGTQVLKKQWYIILVDIRDLVVNVYL